MRGTHDAPDPGPDARLLELLQQELDLSQTRGHTFRRGDEHTERWNHWFSSGKTQLIRDDGTLDPAVLRDFRRRRVFTGDNPVSDPSLTKLVNLLHPKRRGERELLRRCLHILEENGYESLLAKYPSPTIGNPYLFEHRDHRYTHRWFRHVYSLGLLGRVLGERLPQGFTTLDIGSAYGILSSLLHQEYPGSHHVLVDLPEQLLLASYFLRRYLPRARIGTAKELAAEKSIGRELLEQYDFVLMSPEFYEGIEPGSVDLVTSFAALGELKRSYFDYYLKAPVFRSARFFATANPVNSKRMFTDSDVTVLDYPLWDPRKRLHFDLAPTFFHPYSYPRRRSLFGYELRKFQVFFEYVGEL
jgi:putative sugar O-methyltransferase